MRLGTPITLLTIMLSACADHWAPAFDDALAPNQLDRVRIADPDEALTFARIAQDGRRHVIAVTGYESGNVEGIDLNIELASTLDDPIELFNERGYDSLRAAVRNASSASRVRVAAPALEIPIDLGGHHIAAGTNFPAHADDAGTERPFLFAKLVQPTAAFAPVDAGSGLLDYEVELALVPLVPLAQGTRPERLGLILCNDYTDRETLMRHIDPRDIESGKGFTTGKSFPSYLPVGNLFVIPRQLRDFVRSIELRLYVNERLRQRAMASEMIWDIDEILAQTWARREARWEHRGEQVALLPGSEVIRSDTLIMTGTPHGTVFAGLPKRYMFTGLLRWLLGGWSQPVPDHVIDAYAAGARSARAYLQAGDHVTIHVEKLGVVRNRVTCSP
jgi:2-keto-4-pentenoate hydratase/2-oxohepta-3-ene-1,7-dioic acid hydratase in catechol pathway